MQFHQLQRVHANKRSVPVGRGGKRGKTSGRGGKGQTARAGRKIYPQIRDMIKRIPKLRGRGKHSFKSFAKKAVPVNLAALERIEGLENGSNITAAFLVEKGIVARRSGNIPRVKILGGGAFTRKVAVTGLEVSQSAKAAIEKAGGTVSS